MQKYYKIVTEKSYLNRICDIDDISNIPAGTTVVASMPFKNSPEHSFNGHLNIDEPVTHFCDNAFDLMLWHNIFDRLYQASNAQTPPVIYEIVPLSDVIKDKCGDKLGLYQCGANIIKFKSKMSLNRMFNRAVKEFKNNRDEKIKMYPGLPLQKLIDAWTNYRQPMIIR